MKKGEVKREGARALCSIVFIYYHFYAYSKHRLIRKHDIDIQSDQSDNSDATFYITSNRVCR